MLMLIAVCILTNLYGSSNGEADVCLRVSDPRINREAFSNPGLYNPASLTDNICRIQCWQRLQISVTQMALGKFCFCGNWSVNGGSSNSSSCVSVCPGGAGNCGSVSDFSVVSAYAGLDAIADLNVSIQDSQPAVSFQKVTVTASWQYVNPRATHNSTFTAYYDSDSLAFATASNVANPTTVDLVSSNAGYYSIRGTIVNSDGLPFSVDKIAFVGQYYQNVSLVTPIAFQVDNVAAFTLRITEQMAAQINITYDKQTFYSPRILDTKAYKIGSTSETKANASSTCGAFLSLIFNLTVREEVTLEQIRVNTRGISCPVIFQVYRPYCAAGSYYCYDSNKCVSSNQSCASSNFRKVNCSNGLVYKLSGRACSRNTTSFSPPQLTNAEFSNYYLYFETSSFIVRGSYQVAIDSPTTPVRITLLPGDIPALYHSSCCFVSKGTQRASSLMVQALNIANFYSRSQNYSIYLGNPSVNFNSTGPFNSPINAMPLIEMDVVKPAYFVQQVTTKNPPPCATSPMSCHSVGNYSFSFVLQNAYSSYNDMQTVRVYIPVTNVSISVPATAKSFQNVSIGVTLAGSLPTYIFSVNDSSLPGNWILEGDGNYSVMVFSHIFTRSGIFNVSVLAGNPLSTGSDSGVIQVLNSVADLSVWPLNLPGQKLGLPSTFLVSLSQASAADVTIDFGDGVVQSATVDDANLFISRGTLDYFVSIYRVYLISQPTTKNFTTLIECLTMCLESTTFYCQAALYDNSDMSCLLYDTTYDPVTLYINYQLLRNSTLYVLKTDICSLDMIKGGRMASWNASSAVNQSADISLSGSGWIGTSNVNQSLQISFVAMTQINAISVQPASNGQQVTEFTMLISNDSQQWIAYQNGIKFNSGSTALRPPIIARFLLLNVLNTSQANTHNAALRLGLTGCAVQTIQLTFNHIYANLGLYNVAVKASNLISSAVTVNKHAVDTPITNLSGQLLTHDKVDLNASAYFAVTGIWGHVFRIYFSRNDGITNLNILQNTVLNNVTFNRFNYSVPTEKLGVFSYNVTVLNYLGVSTAAIDGRVFLEYEVADFVVVGSKFGTFVSPATNITLSDLQLCVNATLPDPTLTILTVNYGDNSSAISTPVVCNISLLNGARNSCPALHRFCTFIPPHAYKSFGTMVISVLFYNDVSSMTVNYTYIVWQTVSQLESQVVVLPPFPQGMSVFDDCVPTNSILRFTALMATGSLTPFNLSWNFGDGSPIVNSTTLAINYTYTSPNDQYVVTVAFSNPVSSANSTIVRTMLNKIYTSLCVQDPIVSSALTFINDGPAAINASMNFTFEIAATPPSRSCYMIDFADPQSPTRYTLWGNVSACNASITFSPILPKSVFNSYSESQLQNAQLNYSHAYYKLGRINALLYAANRVSSVILISPVVVTKYACRLPVVDIQKLLKCTSGTNCNQAYGNNVIIFWRSSTITIDSIVTTKCQASVLAYYSWTISACDDSACVNSTAFSFTEHIQHYGAPKLSDFNLKSLTLKPRTFTPGLYQVCLNVSMDGLEDFWTIDCALFSITATPSLISCINNGASVLSELFSVTNFTLDGSCSVDPDLWREENQNLVFEWSCYRPCESPPNFQNLNGSFMGWTPNYTTTCPTLFNGTKSVSTKGCFQPYDVHQSGPIERRSLNDWQATTFPTNPLYKNEAENQAYTNSNPKIVLWYMPTRASLVLNTGLMFYQTQHIILLTVRKSTTPTRWAQTVVFVKFDGFYPPDVDINCVSNCYPSTQLVPADPTLVVNSGSPLKLNGIVKNYSPVLSYSYSWRLVFLSPPLSLVDLGNVLVLSLTRSDYYDFATHSSTLNDKLGLSLDKQLPIFNSSLWDKNVMFILTVNVQVASGYSYVLTKVNRPPQTESCRITTVPSSGVALSTSFTFSCSCNLSATNTYSYSLGYAVGAKNTFSDFETQSETATSCVWLVQGSSACSFNDGTVLPTGDASNGYAVSVCLAVYDKVGSKNYSFVPSPVVNFDANAFAQTMEKLINTSDINEQMKSNQASAIGLIMSLASVITGSAASNSFNISSDLLSTAKLATLNQKVITAISSISRQANSVQTIRQSGQVIAAFTSNPSTVNSECIATATESLANMASNLNQAAGSSTTGFNDLYNAASAIFVATSQVTAATQYNVNSSNATNSSLKTTYSSVQSTISSISQALVNYKVVDEGPSQLTSTNFSLSVQTKSTNAFNYASVKPDGLNSCTCFEFGSNSGLLAQTLNMTPQSASYQHTTRSTSMFSWLPLASQMSSETSMSLFQFSNSTHTDISVTSTAPKSSFIIWIDTGLSPDQIPLPHPANKSLAYTLPKDQPMTTHYVSVKPDAALFISVRQYIAPLEAALNAFNTSTNHSMNNTNNGRNSSDNQTPSSLLPTYNGTYNGTNVRFLVYVTTQSAAPTDSNYQFSCSLPIVDPSELFCRRQDDWPSQAQYAVTDVAAGLKLSGASWWSQMTAPSKSPGEKCGRYSNKTRDPYTCMFPAKMLNISNETVFRIGVRAIIANDLLNVTQVPANTSDLRNNGASTKLNIDTEKSRYVSVNYILLAYPSACYFYNSTSEKFDTSGCTVGGCSSVFATQCICTHLTSFSNVFSLPPIKFDLATVNLDALNSNPGVVMFLLIILCLYCIILIWARRRDLDDEKCVGVVSLPSNDQRDIYGYEVTIWTGHVVSGGTTARVSCIISGDESETKPRYLHNVQLNAFTRGSQRTMLLTTPVWLGELSHIRIWHDNTGASPSWYFSRMLIRDIHTGSKYYFLANTWLAVDRGNGSVNQLVAIAGKTELRGFNHVFWTRSTKQLFDGHMWLSVATRPERSRFTRVQRLSCCLMMCYSAVLFNLLGFIVKNSRTATSGNSDVTIFSLGPVQVSAWTLTMSFIAAFATIPVNMIVLLLFRERALRKSNKQSETDDIYSKYKISNKVQATETSTTISAEKDKNRTHEDDATTNQFQKFSVFLSRKIGAAVRALLPFPWFSHYIAYTVIFTVNGVCWFCVMVLAMSNLTSAQIDSWLQSIILSLMIDIFIIQPLEIVLIVALFSLILREPVSDDTELSRELAINVEDPTLDKKQNILTEENLEKREFLPPPNEAVIEGLRLQASAERQTESALFSIIFFLLFVAITCAAVFMCIPVDAFRQTAEVRSKLAPAKMILSATDFYAYVKHQLLPLINQTVATDGPVSTNKALKLSADGSLYIVSARLRQVRLVPSGNCYSPDWLTSVVPSCSGDFSASTTDTADYNAGWTAAKNDSSITQLPFKYAAEPNPLIFSAALLMNTYPAGSGYMATLGNNLTLALESLNLLISSDWIDGRTRLIFTDVLLYNVQSRLFTACQSYFEFFKGVRYKPVFYSIQMDQYSFQSGHVDLIVQLLATLGIAIFTCLTIYRAKADITWYSKWKLLDWSIIVISFVAIGLYAGFYCASWNSLSQLNNESGLFSTFQFSLVLRTVSYNFMGIVIFLLLIRLIRLLLYSARFALVGRTVANFLCYSASLFFMIFTFVIAFSLTANLLLLSSIETYSTVPQTMMSLVTLLTCKYGRMESVSLAAPVLAPILFILFVFVVAFVFTRLTMGLMQKALHNARRTSAAANRTNDALSYVAGKLRDLWCWTNDDSKGEEEAFAYITGYLEFEQTLTDFEVKSDKMTKRLAVIVGKDNKLNQGLAGALQRQPILS